MKFILTAACFLLSIHLLTGQFEFYASYEPGAWYDITISSTHTCTKDKAYKPVNEENLTDIAVTPNGKIYGIDGFNLYLLNSNNDYLINLFPLKADFGNYCSWAAGLVAINDTFLIFDCHDDLYMISVLDGDIAFLGNTPYGCDGDLAFLNDTLYMSGSGKLIQIILSQIDHHIESYTNIGDISGTYASFLGLFTAFESCETNKKQLYGLAGTKLYCLNTQTANATLICDYPGSSSFGGAASTEDFAQSSNIPVFEIPNVFSPNGDGINDTYHFIDFPYANHTFYFDIYDRWGSLAFRTQNPYFDWDGTTTKSNFISDGVYFYVFKLSSDCMGNLVKTGTITVFK